MTLKKQGIFLGLLLLTGCHPSPTPTPSQLAHNITTVNAEQQLQQTLNQATKQLKQQPQQALRQLQQLSQQPITKDQKTQAHLYYLLSQAHFANQHYLEAISTSELAYPWLTAKEQEMALVTLWRQLHSLHKNTLDHLSVTANSNYQFAWLRFVQATDSSIAFDALKQQLSQWQAMYPQHPANQLIHDSTAMALPKHIALLLPLSGPLKPQGEAIRNGFFAAFYAKQANYAADITVYDSHNQAISLLYQQAKNQGADFVVGPLLKTNIYQLLQQHAIALPTLALNNVSAQQPLLYQFSLSPDQEATQVATAMNNHGLKRVLIISPKTAWGQRIAKQFKNQWQFLQCNIMSELDYMPKHLSVQLSRLLNINQSKNRLYALEKLLGEKLRYTPRRRQDFDAIFLVANPVTARQIMPLLRFYYLGQVPVYSISSIYSGQANPRLDRDLNGIHFVDLPWLIQPNQLPQDLRQIQKNSQHTWPDSYQHYPRFYAFGADAFGLVTRLNRLRYLPQLGIDSATGQLSLQENQQVYRHLSMAVMGQGVAKAE